MGRDRRSGSQDTARCNQAQHRDARRRRPCSNEPWCSAPHLPPSAASQQVATTEPPTTEPAADTFTVQHAENFTLTYDGDHKVLTIGTGDTAETFVLVQRGTEPPALDGDLAGATVIEVPIETMFSESSSHYGFIDVLDIEATVTGVGDASLDRHADPRRTRRRRRDRVVRPELHRRPGDRRRRRPRRLRHRRRRRPGPRGDPRRRDPRRPQPRVAGDDARGLGRVGRRVRRPHQHRGDWPTSCTASGLADYDAAADAGRRRGRAADGDHRRTVRGHVVRQRWRRRRCRVHRRRRRRLRLRRRPIDRVDRARHRGRARRRRRRRRLAVAPGLHDQGAGGRPPTSGSTTSPPGTTAACGPTRFRSTRRSTSSRAGR